MEEEPGSNLSCRVLCVFAPSGAESIAHAILSLLVGHREYSDEDQFRYPLCRIVHPVEVPKGCLFSSSDSTTLMHPQAVSPPLNLDAEAPDHPDFDPRATRVPISGLRRKEREGRNVLVIPHLRRTIIAPAYERPSPRCPVAPVKRWIELSASLCCIDSISNLQLLRPAHSGRSYGECESRCIPRCWPGRLWPLSPIRHWQLSHSPSSQPSR